MKRVLFVCMGNICRSPLAAAALRFRALEEGIAVEVDSAGTHGYHVGEGADPRAVEAGRRRGYDLAAHRARQVSAQELAGYQIVVAMDRSNLERLRRLAPRQTQIRLALMLEFAPETGEVEVPDPYYGGAQAFERALDLIDAAAAGLLRRMTK